ncbi:hypothetical protein Vadar_010264 [Vaccinium darrowii]|uniref:Uncharacterized protein n=1 Tax=Vaccinium darrowii TaxID=229202 RepID=A0ACB7Y5R1_9ERIC|nr:hypothetical protein Vadar_010264 [Vaccinium darrowii]
MEGELQLMEPSGLENPSDSDPLLENQRAVNSPPLPEVSNEVRNDDFEAGAVACCRICLECDGEEGWALISCMCYLSLLIDDELISPCMCKGTQQFVHRSCLDHWRSVKEGFAFSHCTTCKAQFHLQITEFEDNIWLSHTEDIFEAFYSFTWRYLRRKQLRRDFNTASPSLNILQVIAAMAGFAYVMDNDGIFRKTFNDSWDRILSKHPMPFYYCIGVLSFFVLLGFFGLILHCSSFGSNDPRMAGCQNCCYGWGILDCFPASLEACFFLVIVFVIIFAILGIAYGFLAATMAIQRIWQRHYHILTKRELTKEYIVKDLHGCYSPPKLDPEHEERLKVLKLLQ